MSDHALDLTRQSGIIPTERVAQTHITIVGAGAIGSHLAECVAKLGISTIEVYDYDSVEKHNLPNQGYQLSDIGMLKVDALKNRLEEGYGCTVNAHNMKVDEHTELGTGIVVAAVDSMSARKAIMAACENSMEPTVLIDPRMGAQYGEIRVVDLLEQAEIVGYISGLFSDDEAYQAPCTEKATIFCAAGMAAFITSMIALMVRDEKTPKLVEMDFARMTVSVAA